MTPLHLCEISLLCVCVKVPKEDNSQLETNVFYFQGFYFLPLFESNSDHLFIIQISNKELFIMI